MAILLDLTVADPVDIGGYSTVAVGGSGGSEIKRRVVLEDLLWISTPNTARSSGYAIAAADSVNTPAVKGTVNVFSGTTNTVNVNTGLGTYAAATPLEFAVMNLGTGNLTVAGTATVNVPTGFTAVVVAKGMAILRQTATNVFVLSGALVAA